MTGVSYDNDDVRVKAVDENNPDDVDFDKKVTYTADGNKVRLDTSPIVDFAPTRQIMWGQEYLLRSGSPDMDVDGDPTPREFIYQVGAGETVYLDKIGVLLIDRGTMDDTDFGSTNGGGLDNGVEVKIKAAGTEYDYLNLQTNMDLALAFPEQVPFRAGGDANYGFLDEDDIFLGFVSFKPVIKLVANDYVKFVINDDIDNLQRFRARVYFWSSI